MSGTKHNAARAVLSVLIVLVFLFDIFWMIGTIGIAVEDSSSVDDSLLYLTSVEVDGSPRLETIGTTYEGNARAGYTYYRLHIPVLSVGTNALWPEYDLYMDVEGDDYDDVERYYNYEEEETQPDIFVGTNREIIPSGRRGELTEVLQIRDGAGRIYVTVYPTSDDYYNETNGTEMEIRVP